MSPRVLIVEPYADLRASIAAILRREHYTCDTAASADAARAELGQSDYQYVIVELDMADQLGLVKSPMIVLTDTYVQGTGSVASLRKPFGRDELMARLNN